MQRLNTRICTSLRPEIEHRLTGVPIDTTFVTWLVSFGLSTDAISQQQYGAYSRLLMSSPCLARRYGMPFAASIIVQTITLSFSYLDKTTIRAGRLVFSATLAVTEGNHPGVCFWNLLDEGSCCLGCSVHISYVQYLCTRLLFLTTSAQWLGLGFVPITYRCFRPHAL